MNKKLKYINPLPIDNFPFIEGSFDSLTEYGYIQKLIYSINKLIEQVNEHQNFIDNYESQIEGLQTQINEINRKVNELASSIDEKFDEIISDLNVRFNAFRTEILQIIQNNYSILKNYVDERDAYLEDKINNISIDSIVLRDPTTGLYSNIQVVINNLYNQSNVDGITAGEFDDLTNLTTYTYDAQEITAIDFDTKSKIILML